MRKKVRKKLQLFFTFNSLQAQLFSRFLLIMIGLLLLVGFLQQIIMKNFIYKNQASSIHSQILTISTKEWQRIIKEVDNDAELPFIIPGVTLSYIDANRFLILAQTPDKLDPPVLEKSYYEDTDESNKVEDKQDKVRYQVFQNEDGQQLIVLHAIRTEDGDFIGTIQANMSTKPLKNILWRQVLIFSMISAFMMLIVFLTLRAVLRKILVPLSTINDTLKTMHAEHLDKRLPINQGQYEIDHLSISFNTLLERLERSFEQEAHSKNQMQRFIADISHELRTPLTSIHGFTEILLRSGKPINPDKLQLALKSMYGESKRVNKLVEDLILLTKIDSMPKVEMKEGSLDALIKEMKPQLHLLAGERTLDFSLQPDAKAIFNRDKIKQVILNLFYNAVQYTHAKDGVIKIALEQSKEGILISIQDNGTGIPEEKTPHIFDRFYRIESSRSRGSGGAGLGLAITKSIIESHGGSIQVKSEKNSGTSFRISLPR